MRELQQLAEFAADKRIRGRSYKRNSLLKPLDIILNELERSPDPTDENELLFIRTSSKGLVYEHIKRIAPKVPEKSIYDYIDLFFDEVLGDIKTQSGAHHGNANKLLQRERSLRSAYLVFMRQAIAEFFIEQGKAKSAEDAMQEMDIVEEDENDEQAS